MQLNGKTLAIVGVLLACGYGAWKFYAKGVAGKTNDELFQMVAQGGAKSVAAEAELMTRADGGRCDGPTFRAQLASPSKEVRVVACKGLKKTKDADSVKPAIAAFKDDAAEVRAAAASVFEAVRVKDAIDPLIKLLEDSNEDVRISASNALRSITKQKYSNKEADGWREWWASNKGTFVVKPE